MKTYSVVTCKLFLHLLLLIYMLKTYQFTTVCKDDVIISVL